MDNFAESFHYDHMKNIRILLFIVLLASQVPTACNEYVSMPVVGDYSVYEVDVDELSGLCMNRAGTALLSCGDKGVVKEISFEGEVTDVWTYGSDMEGITVDPSSGDIYLAIEGKQEVHVLAAPAYDSQEIAFAVSEAVEDNYKNSGLEAVEYYMDDILFVGSQQDANLWQYRKDGTLISKISLSSFASEIAGLCYEPQEDLLWVADSKKAMIFICTVEGELLASYAVPFIDNAESVCVDRERKCIWVGSDEDATRLYRIDFSF